MLVFAIFTPAVIDDHTRYCIATASYRDTGVNGVDVSVVDRERLSHLGGFQLFQALLRGVLFLNCSSLEKNSSICT